jgi:hypothetical protein
MKERPIPFSGPMACALLRPTNPKWQTRRIMKVREGGCVSAEDIADNPSYYIGCGHCPYGQPGDQLWVKESYCQKVDDDGCLVYNTSGNLDPSCFYYSADPDCPHIVCSDGDGGTKYNKDGSEASPWRSPRFMPRHASRILLEITEIRVQRLQEISDEDCIAEGIFNGEHDPGLDKGGEPGWCYGPNVYAGSPLHAYELLWESLHGAGSWAANPHVWAISFKRVTPK